MAGLIKITRIQLEFRFLDQQLSMLDGLTPSQPLNLIKVDTQVISFRVHLQELELILLATLMVAVE